MKLRHPNSTAYGTTSPQTPDVMSHTLPRSPASRPTARILVVDDDPVNLRVLANQLSLLECSVTAVTTGAEALERVDDDGPFDLVILDVMMPRMSGYEVCRRLRERFSLFELPILMVTARNRPGDDVVGLEAGANDYLTKPFERAELAARVQTLLELRRAAQRAITTTRQMEAERQKRILAEELHDLTHALTSTLKLPEVLHRLLHKLKGAVPYDEAIGFVRREGRFEPEAAAGGKIGVVDMEQASELASKVAATGGVVQSRSPADAGKGTEAKAWLGVPVLYQDALLGVIVLRRRAPLTFKRAEVDMAASSAGQAGVAMENARLFSELQRHVSLLQRLHEVSRALTEPLALDGVLRRIIDGVQQGLGLDRVSVFLVDRKEGVVRGRLRADGEGNVVPLDTTYPLEGHLLGDIALGKRAHYRKIDEKDDLLPHEVTGGGPAAAVPLISRQGTVGVLCAGNSPGGASLAPEVLDWLALFAGHAASAIQHAVYEQTQELERAQRTLIAAEERTRREVAELLHGRVQSRLLLVWHRLGECAALLGADLGRAEELLKQARADIDEVREQEIRNVSHLLHPSVIRVGLIPAVRSLSARFADMFTIDLQVDDEVARLDAPVDRGLPEQVRLVAYRVLEEALSNTSRHGGADSAQVSLAIESRQLRVTVSDNGRGFDVADARRGLGFDSIAAYVGQVGGVWDVKSAPGQGTTLSASLPLAAEGDEDPVRP